jgi:hypothetical protein
VVAEDRGARGRIEANNTNTNLLLSGKRLADAQDWWSKRSAEDLANVINFVDTSILTRAKGRIENI